MATFVHPTAEVKGKISNGTKVWNQAQIRKGAVIGKNCIIGKNVYIDSDVIISDNCKIQNNVNIYNATIHKNVFIGPNTTFTNDKYPRAFIWNESKKTPKTEIEEGASIGAGSIVIGGITIGKYAMIGCGSIVTKNVKPFTLMYGSPAQSHGKVNEKGEKADKRKKERNNCWSSVKTKKYRVNFKHFEDPCGVEGINGGRINRLEAYRDNKEFLRWEKGWWAEGYPSKLPKDFEPIYKRILKKYNMPFIKA